MLNDMHHKSDERRPRLWNSFILFILIVLLSGICWTVEPLGALAEDYNSNFMNGVDFSGQDLTDSSFVRSKLRYGNLSHANLESVDLFGADLRDSNLEGVNLRNAVLDTARFQRANLTNAILEDASAFNAKFDGAIVTGADFTNVLLRKDGQILLCTVATGTNPVTGRSTRDTLDCS